jgi:hypothetical protein
MPMIMMTAVVDCLEVHVRISRPTCDKSNTLTHKTLGKVCTSLGHQDLPLKCYRLEVSNEISQFLMFLPFGDL